jgi:hypothetical protein
MTTPNAIPLVSVTYAHDGTSTQANALGMRPMQERAYQKRGELPSRLRYLLLLVNQSNKSSKSRMRSQCC